MMSGRLAFVCLAILATAIYFPYETSWRSMVTVWNTPTYSHSYLIPIASLWLAYRQRATLKRLPVTPYWPALAGVLVVGAGWLVGELAGVNAPRHAAIIGYCVLSIIYVFGAKIGRKIVFPLGFVLLAIPLGDFMIPAMMTWTANVTIWLVQLSGVPIYREGLSFVLPSGAWQVIEECSGQRYLIAILPLALIFAQLSYQRTRTKCLFVGSALSIAIVANWIRAYTIVMTGHLSNMKLAVGVDHLIYGWIFFGIIVTILFLWGSRWREAALPAPPKVIDPLASADSNKSYPFLIVAVCGLIALSTGSLAADFLVSREPDSGTLSLSVSSAEFASQRPLESVLKNPFNGAKDEVSLTLGDGSSHAWLGQFSNLDHNTEMIHNRHSVVAANGPKWRHIDTQVVTHAEPEPFQARELRFVGAGKDLLVWQIYQVDGRFVESDSEAKLRLALQRLRAKGSSSTVILLWTTFQSDVQQAKFKLRSAATTVIAKLIRANGE